MNFENQRAMKHLLWKIKRIFRRPKRWASVEEWAKDIEAEQIRLGLKQQMDTYLEMNKWQEQSYNLRQEWNEWEEQENEER
jgi:hypothetical protein